MQSKQKKQAKRATVKTPIEKLGEADTIKHYNAVLLENIKDEIKTVIEKLGSLEVSLTKKLDEIGNRSDRRLEAFKAAIAKHGEMLNGHGLRVATIEKAPSLF